MALALNDIVQITDWQQYLGQVMLNVYFYRITAKDANAGYDDLAKAFQDDVLTPIAGIQQSTCIHTGLSLKNVSNNLDIFEYPLAVAGAVTLGEGLPSLVALSFRLIRTDASTRHGSKRIGAIPEGNVNGNTYAGSMGPVNAIATAMALPIVDNSVVDNGITAVPVIVGRYPKGHPNAGELNVGEINPVQAAQFIRVSSQVTRRAGRGM